MADKQIRSLKLSRKIGGSIVLRDLYTEAIICRVTLDRTSKDRARLLFEAPDSVEILREELLAERDPHA